MNIAPLDPLLTFLINFCINLKCFNRKILRFGGANLELLPRSSLRKGTLVFIQTEETPNPSTLKFLPGQTVLRGESKEFLDASGASHSPLAKRLFSLEGVKSVFFGENFVSITKTNDETWQTLKPNVLGALMDHFLSGDPLIHEQDNSEAPEEEELDEISKEIKEMIDARVRPAVAADGGDITFVKFESGIVYLKLQGACSGCPSSSATLKSGIENMLRYYIPEVEAVEAING